MVTARLELRVRPRAGRAQVRGRRSGGAVEVWVKSAPEGGKANSELLRVLAQALGRKSASIRIVRGATSRLKLVEIEGMTPQELASWVGSLDPA